MKKLLKWGCLGTAGLVVLLIVAAMLAPKKDSATTASVAQPATTQQATQAQAQPTGKPLAATPTAVALAKVGDAITVGNWRYTVSKVDRQKTVVWSQYGNKTDAKGIWQIVHIQVENIGKQTYPINTWDFEVKDAGDITYKADSNSISYSSFAKLDKPSDNYPPGVPAEIGVIFDVNPNATGLKLWLVQAKTAVDLGQ